MEEAVLGSDWAGGEGSQVYDSRLITTYGNVIHGHVLNLSIVQPLDH